jgi:hypothetical protein
MAYENWRRKRVNVADIDLDPDNIRLDIPEKTQEALMADLFMNEKAMELVENIAKEGVYPDEQPIVIEENGRYIMMEGNRRLAAMKALNDPSLIRGFQQKISLIAATFPGLTDIEVQVAPSRAEVQRHVANRHTSVTREPWRPLRQAYFYVSQLLNGKTVKQLRQEYPGADIPDFVRNWEMHQLLTSVSTGDPAVDAKLRDQRKFPINVLSRLIEDKAFLAEFGLKFDADGHLNLPTDRTRLDAALKKIGTDIASKKNAEDHIDTRILNDDKLRGPYIERLKAEANGAAGAAGGGAISGAAGGGTGGGTVAPTTPPPPAPVTSPTAAPTTPAAPTPTRRTKLAPNDIIVAITSPGVKRLLIELQNIDYHRYPISTHDSLRSFLECSLKAYFKHKGHTPAPSGGFVQLNRLLTDFTNASLGFGDTGTRQVAARIQSNPKMVGYTASFLNATNHNPDIFPTPAEVEHTWDSLEPLLRYILNP